LLTNTVNNKTMLCIHDPHPNEIYCSSTSDPYEGFCRQRHFLWHTIQQLQKEHLQSEHLCVHCFLDCRLVSGVMSIPFNSNLLRMVIRAQSLEAVISFIPLSAWPMDIGCAKHRASAFLPSRPALPTCCQYEGSVLGAPQWSTMSMSGQLTPIPKALVEMRHLNEPPTVCILLRMRCSSALFLPTVAEYWSTSRFSAVCGFPANPRESSRFTIHVYMRPISGLLLK
jgi:hypothetical protein